MNQQRRTVLFLALAFPWLTLLGCGRIGSAAKDGGEVTPAAYLAKALVIKTEILMLCRQTHQLLDPIVSEPERSFDDADVRVKMQKILSGLADQEANLLEIPAVHDVIAYRDTLRKPASLAQEACKTIGRVIDARARLAKLQSTADLSNRGTQAGMAHYRELGPSMIKQAGQQLKAMDESIPDIDPAEESLRKDI